MTALERATASVRLAFWVPRDEVEAVQPVCVNDPAQRLAVLGAHAVFMEKAFRVMREIACCGIERDETAGFVDQEFEKRMKKEPSHAS
jgi:hypothetical protein